MKQLFSDFIAMMFGEPDEGETHSWGTIIGVMLFLAFIGFMLSMAS
ncbi:hypothetical protein [Roseivirga thermotolerans]|nr:hypothetical protein [Roseivirga thermotolerans]